MYTMSTLSQCSLNRHLIMLPLYWCDFMPDYVPKRGTWACAASYGFLYKENISPAASRFISLVKMLGPIPPTVL